MSVCKLQFKNFNSKRSKRREIMILETKLNRIILSRDQNKKSKFESKRDKFF